MSAGDPISESADGDHGKIADAAAARVHTNLVISPCGVEADNVAVRLYSKEDFRVKQRME